MKKEIKKTEKYVTDKTFKLKFSTLETKFDAFEDRFESSARATAKSFADNAEITTEILSELKNLNMVSTTMLKEIKTIHEDNKYFRQSISSLDMNDLSYDRKLENLTVRVEKLEKAK